MVEGKNFSGEKSEETREERRRESKIREERREDVGMRSGENGQMRRTGGRDAGISGRVEKSSPQVIVSLVLN